MHDNTIDLAGATPVADEHAQIIALMTSDAWMRRLDEARVARARIIAQRGLTAMVPHRRRCGERQGDHATDRKPGRLARRDLLPPLAPPETHPGPQRTGIVIRLVPRAAIGETLPHPANGSDAGPAYHGRTTLLWLTGGLVLGALIGTVLHGLI